jgi:hypothetical protein
LRAVNLPTNCAKIRTHVCTHVLHANLDGRERP